MQCLHLYYRSGEKTVKTRYHSGRYHYSDDVWRTGYFDITLGEFQLQFVTGDQLKTAIDDVMLLDGMCNNVCECQICICVCIFAT